MIEEYNIVGKCAICGDDILEFEDRFECESRHIALNGKNTFLDNVFSHDMIRKDSLMKWGGCLLDTQDAIALFSHQTINVQLKSKYGKWYYTRIYYEDGKIRFLK